MNNSQEAQTREQEKRAHWLLKDLHSAFNDNEIFVESLHTMFVAYALNEELNLDEKIINSYLTLRYFLRESETVFNPKNERHA